MSGVVTLGETMGLFTAATPGSLSHVDHFRLGIGGAESNVAIGLARLGTPATWIGRIGDDEIGALVRREIQAEGVEAIAIVDPGAATGLMVKSRRTPDHSRVTYYRAASAGSRLAPGDATADVIASADLLHVTGITPALSASASAAIDIAIDIAREAGVPVSFDVNHRHALWNAERAAPVYRAIAARATVLFAGLEEAALLVAGDSAAELARGLAALGPNQVVVKLGGDGCHALIDGDAIDVAAIPVAPVDTVGAGDAFVAGYLAELLAGSNPAARLSTAVRAGAFACLGAGDWESLPSRSDLELFDGGDPVSR
jgi:2-dehydro-3-deoxygluconokinase